MVNTALYGLVGKGISHSFSGRYFNSKFKKEGLDAYYHLFDIDSIERLSDILREYHTLRGLNITSPYKSAVIPFLDELSQDANQLQAVNVVKITHCPDGNVILKGFNTDEPGFAMTIEALHLPKDISALVMGSGGASSAVTYVLSKFDIPFKVVSRTPLANQISYEQMNELIESHKLIINATPVGMYPLTNQLPTIDYSRISPSHICYDLIYNPSKSLFLQKCEERGARIVNGLDMLINQAELSWKIWNE